MNKKIILVSTILSLLPKIALAQILFPGIPPLTAGVDLFQLIIVVASVVLDATWIIAVAFVVVAFVIAGFKFLTAQGDPNKLHDARQAVIWGAGGVIVILLAFSILVVMRRTLGV